VFQDISNPFVLRQLEIETVNGGFTMEGGPLEFRSNTGNSEIRWGGPEPIVVNQDWQVNSSLAISSSLTNGVGSGLLIHNGQISGTGNFSLFRNSMIVNGTIAGLSSINVAVDGVLQIDGIIDSSVGSVVIGTQFANPGFSGTITGNGTINTSVQLDAGINFMSSTGTLTVNGDVFSVGEPPNGTSYALRMTAGRIDVNGDVRNAVLLVGSDAVLGGNGAVFVGGIGDEFFVGQGGLVVDGRITADKMIVLADNTGSASNPTSISGSGVIDANIISQGGQIYGNLTLNGDVAVEQGVNVNTTFGRSVAPSDLLTINGDVTFDSDYNVFGEIAGSGRITTSENRLGFYSAKIGGIESVVQGELWLNSTEFRDTSAIFLESGRLTLYNDNLFDGQITSNGLSEIQFIQAGNLFNGDITIKSGELRVSGGMDGSGVLTIKSGASIVLTPSSSIRLNVINEGLIDGTAAKATIDSNLTSRGGEFQGLFDVTGTMTVESGWQSVLRSGADGLVEGQVFVNQSALSIQAGAVLRGPEALIVNGGQLSVNGEVRRNTVIDASSLLTGSGLFFGEVLVEGRLDPGNSAGTVGIDGSLTLGETSVVTIEIGGSAPGTYDVIDGRGVSVLNLQGGGLDLQFIDGFLPDDVMEFDIFRNFASINGQFGGSFFFGGNADGGDHGDRFHFDRGSFAIEYGATFVRLSDFQAAIPNPPPLGF
jgi:fibronectin-binding autotransporter adhesin